MYACICVEIRPAQWVFIHLGLYAYSCSQLMELWFIDIIMYMYVYTCTSEVTFLFFQISFLDSVPDIHMHEHVPEFIDGLFLILGDQRREIRRM